MNVSKIRGRLKQIREAAKLTPDELARKMGKSFPPNHIIGIEEGTRNIGIATIEKYCRFCEAEWDLTIRHRGKVWELDFINITPGVYEAWMKIAREEGSKILAIYPDLTEEDISDERFLELPNGTGEIYCFVGKERLSLPIEKHEWAWANLN